MTTPNFWHNGGITDIDWATVLTVLLGLALMPAWHFLLRPMYRDLFLSGELKRYCSGYWRATEPDPTVTAAQIGYNKAVNKLAEGEARIRIAKRNFYEAERNLRRAKLIESLTDRRRGY